MKGSNMRDKARAIFGKTFFENTKEPAPAKNAAVALQKRANARPIPTYKVGGVVKKQAGGALTAAEKARAQAMIKERGDAAMRDPLVMRYLDEQNRAPMSVPGMGPKAATKRAEGGGIEAQRLEARAAAGRYKDGGNVQKKAAGGKAEDRGPTTVGQRDAAYHRMKGAAALPEQKTNLSLRDRQTEVEALARKISNATGKTGVVTQSSQAPVARGSAKEMAQGDYGVPVRAIARPGDNIAVKLPAKQVGAKRAYKKGGEIAKKASGGMSARSDRDVPVAKARGPKNEIIVQPVKRAVGGAGKTRKGMC